MTLALDLILSVSCTAGSVVLRWPVAAASYNLYSSSRLGPGATWMLIAAPAPVPDPANANLLKVVLPASASSFYRLQK